jgi:hypothetical protein
VDLWDQSSALKAGLQASVCTVTLSRITRQVVVAAAAGARPGQRSLGGGWVVAGQRRRDRRIHKVLRLSSLWDICSATLASADRFRHAN